MYTFLILRSLFSSSSSLLEELSLDELESLDELSELLESDDDDDDEEESLLEV